jgi:hypothetical protein
MYLIRSCLLILTEMPNFPLGDNGQQVCRRQALYSNHPTSFFAGLEPSLQACAPALEREHMLSQLGRRDRLSPKRVFCLQVQGEQLWQ